MLRKVSQRLSVQSTMRMENLSEGMYNETVAMRVLAVITLIYLPATFSSVSLNKFACRGDCGD